MTQEISMNWSQVIAGLASAIFVSVVTAVLTVQLALRRFYSEKWWERRSNAYSEIIKALHHVREHADTNLEFALRDRDLPEDGEKRLTEEMQKAMAQLRLHRDLGVFVICDEAVDLLNTLFKELDDSTKTEWWQEHLELKLVAVDKCLKEMRRIARRELKISA
jgi:hypothetical protein